MKKHISFICMSLLMISCSASGRSVSPADHAKKVHVLIVDGFSNHDWQATTRAIISILSRDKNLEVDVSTVPKEGTRSWEAWNPDFDLYDVVIQNTNDISKKGSWPQAAKESLERFISGGGGMLAYHSANNAFRDWGEYNRMIGLGWRDQNFGPAIIIENNQPIVIPAGKGSHTGHGKRVDTLVTRLGNHPIHAGLPQQWMAADIEVYRYARGPAENISILSYANDSKTGLNFPTEWVVAYGQGWVYSSTFGHYWHDLEEDPSGIRCAAFQEILIRTVRWLGGAEVKADTPEDFPASDQVSLRALSENRSNKLFH